MTEEHFRGVLLVKLLQIIKLKKNASRQTVHYLVQVLNENINFTVSIKILNLIFILGQRR